VRALELELLEDEELERNRRGVRGLLGLEAFAPRGRPARPELEPRGEVTLIAALVRRGAVFSMG
jgi:hypothetical protein